VSFFFFAVVIPAMGFGSDGKWNWKTSYRHDPAKLFLPYGWMVRLTDSRRTQGKVSGVPHTIKVERRRHIQNDLPAENGGF
jgi:hypothetical protein